ncbi:hypothetical protein [Acetonema longum]|uniref:Uncharacterized protein n=1 Tax=Acetonema longum DSM 6540 TaxID=1009370 RepID=F7NMB5_9FIRM|nr:hypothetical protein [Acetonema longum]EGO62818.1 hypothetical protein ALO_16212 [Acetonema longum DSM 6540]
MRKKIISWVVLTIFGITVGVIDLHLYPNKILAAANVSIARIAEQNRENLNKEKHQNKEKFEKVLIGSWHRSPTMMTGMLNLYTFSKDKSFIFKYRRSDTEKRMIDISGKWEIIHENLLYLIITDETVIEGGEFIKDINQFTGWALHNGTPTKKKVDPPREVIYPLKDLKIDEKFDEEHVSPIMVKIGGEQYWKYGSIQDEESLKNVPLIQKIFFNESI